MTKDEDTFDLPAVGFVVIDRNERVYPAEWMRARLPCSAKILQGIGAARYILTSVARQAPKCRAGI
jgi:hypothetical protein